MIEDYIKFREDLSNTDYSDKFLLDWFNNVQNNHQEIRSFLNGIKIELDIKIKEESIKIDNNEFNLINQNLSKYTNGRFFIFLKEWIDGDIIEKLKLPSTYIKNNEYRSSISLISSVLKKIRLSLYISDEHSKEINKNLTKLTNLYKNIKIQNKDVTIILDTSAKAFLNLGKYTVDSNSCFRDNRSNSDNKFSLGQTKNTFVLLIKEKEDFIFRSWGYFNQKDKIFNISNIYVASDFLQSTYLHILKYFFASLLNEEDINKIFINKNKIKCEHYIYANSWGNFSFSLTEKIKHQYILTNIDNIKKLNDKFCLCCGKIKLNDENVYWGESQKRYCENCIKNMIYCEYDDVFVDKDLPLVELILEDSSIVKTKLLNIPAIQCDLCHRYALSDSVNFTEKGFICQICSKI